MPTNLEWCCVDKEMVMFYMCVSCVYLVPSDRETSNDLIINAPRVELLCSFFIQAMVYYTLDEHITDI